MCLICDHLDQNKLTPWEAAKNRSEMIEDLDEEHIKLLDHKIRFALKEYLDNLNNEEETNE